jgi:hypothetical protein
MISRVHVSCVVQRSEELAETLGAISGALQFLNDSMYTRRDYRLLPFGMMSSFTPCHRTFKAPEIARQKNLGLGLDRSALMEDLRTNTQFVVGGCKKKMSRTNAPTTRSLMFMLIRKKLGKPLRPIKVEAKSSQCHAWREWSEKAKVELEPKSVTLGRGHDAAYQGSILPNSSGAASSQVDIHAWQPDR